MAQTATVTVIRANAIWTGGTEAKMLYRRDLVIQDGIVAGIERLWFMVKPGICIRFSITV